MKNYQKLLRNLAYNYLVKTDDNTLQEMKESAYTQIAVPFQGNPVIITVRAMNEARIRACGAFGIFDFFKDKKEGDGPTELSDVELGDIVDIQERVLKDALYSPTYEEIVEKVYGHDEHLKELREEAGKLEEKLLEAANSDNPADRMGLRDAKKRLKTLKMSTGFLIPADFAAALTSWVLGVERTDISVVTKSMLQQAGFLAKQNSTRASDYINGIFTDYQRTEIDSAAIAAWAQYEKEARELEEAKSKGMVVHKFNQKE